MQQNRELKVVILGDSGVGQSSVLLRFTSGQFKANTDPTLGAAFMSKIITCQEQTFKFQIWDTAGQQKFKALAPLYYREAHIALLVFDITNRNSFEVLKHWVAELRQQGPSKIMLAVVGNKVDLVDKEQVQFDQARAYARDLQALFKYTSAKENQGISEIFHQMAEEIIKQESESNPSSNETPSNGKSGNVVLDKKNNEKQKGGGCC